MIGRIIGIIEGIGILGLVILYGLGILYTWVLLIMISWMLSPIILILIAVLIHC
jgi:hypothetical protein